MSGKRLLLGVTGGIAAFKVPFLIRILQREGVAVRTVVTEHALQFITRVTLESLTGFPVASGLFDNKEHNFEHIELANWAQVMAVAPATANSMAKYATGVADDLLSTLFVAFKGPVVIAPAMNDAMYTDHTVGKNLRALHERGVMFCSPATGYLACGSEGPGRMAEPEQISEKVLLCFKERSSLEDRRVLITAGATREFIDPVRFITNRSTGKMGYAIAEAFIKYGARVTLISGQSNLYPPPGAEFVPVVSAQEMHDAVMARCDEQDVIIKAAAVADYTPIEVKENKIKKSGDGMTLELKRTPDILAALGERKKKGQILIGFSAETENHLENSVRKLKKKNLDMIVLNDVAAKDSGFEVDTNRVLFIKPAGKEGEVAGGITWKLHREIRGINVLVDATPLLSKTCVADALVKRVIDMIRV